MSTISSGTTSTTTLVHSGDTTGALVFKTNDTGSGGTTAVTIDTSQNVGIGTTSPGSKLHVSSSTNTPAQIQSSGTTSAYLQMTNTGGGGFISTNNNDLVFSTTGSATERMRIDSSGNVGIGTSSPSYPLQVSKGTTGTISFMVNPAGLTNFAVIPSNSSSTGTQIGTTGGDTLGFITNNTERMRIDSSGNLLVGQTSSGGNFCLEAGNTVTSGVSADRLFGVNLGSLSCGKSGGNYAWVGYNIRFTNTTDSYKYNVGDYASAINFKQGGVQTQTAVSGTAGNAISWVSGPYINQGNANWTAGSSDVRLKKNFEPSQGLAELMQVEPVKYHFNWDADSTPKRLGFKAQNLLPLIPEMVVEKDEKAEDGTPYLTITPDYILPVLVKAIQELKALVDTQATEIAQLKAKVG